MLSHLRDIAAKPANPVFGVSALLYLESPFTPFNFFQKQADLRSIWRITARHSGRTVRTRKFEVLCTGSPWQTRQPDNPLMSRNDAECGFAGPCGTDGVGRRLAAPPATGKASGGIPKRALTPYE